MYDAYICLFVRMCMCVCVCGGGLASVNLSRVFARNETKGFHGWAAIYRPHSAGDSDHTATRGGGLEGAAVTHREKDQTYTGKH